MSDLTDRVTTRKQRRRWPTAVAAVAIVATAAAAIVIGILQNGSGSSATQAAGDLFDSRHVIYRNLKPGGDFSRIGYVAADDSNAEPAIAEAKCLRVAAAARS